MFSGIIEKIAPLIDIKNHKENKIFTLENPYDEAFYIDQSIAHNGACLTVIDIKEKTYKVEAIRETLNLTNLDILQKGDLVNLERSIKAQTRMDGHMVSGHVDCCGSCVDISDENGSWNFSFKFPVEHSNLIIQKGSITINGISLTVSNIVGNVATVSIIPYTYDHTNLQYLKIGSIVNLEFDIIGKYVVKYMQKIKP